MLQVEQKATSSFNLLSSKRPERKKLSFLFQKQKIRKKYLPKTECVVYQKPWERQTQFLTLDTFKDLGAIFPRVRNSISLPMVLDTTFATQYPFGQNSFP